MFATIQPVFVFKDDNASGHTYLSGRFSGRSQVAPKSWGLATDLVLVVADEANIAELLSS